jgi:myo-inositol-1(or 4)-monophosphatase
MGQRQKDLGKIESALREAEKTLEPFTPGAIEVDRKAGGDPVTEADRLVDTVLKRILPVEGEGWLSEETVDDHSRLDHERAWVVDPLDGTKEFVQGIPEWCVSIGLVENGKPVAGGILNPTTGQLILGAVETGVTLNGQSVRISRRDSLEHATVLASRSEVNRGEWAKFEDRGYRIDASGSVAFKLGLVAAGLADATWTLVPKNEWDVVGGVALIRAAGGWAEVLDDPQRRFNRADPLMAGLIASGPHLEDPIRAEIEALRHI